MPSLGILDEVQTLLMITVLMGAPAAGKTTWLKQNKTGNEHIYSADLVRVDKDLDVDYYMATIRSKVIKAVMNGKNVIADGTHTIKTHRMFWLALAKRYHVETKLIVFDTPLQLLLKGNSMRQYPCATDVLLKHHKSMPMAKRHAMREAWNSIDRLVRDV